jgi:hypothetical protein
MGHEGWWQRQQCLCRLNMKKRRLARSDQLDVVTCHPLQLAHASIGTKIAACNGN